MRWPTRRRCPQERSWLASRTWSSAAGNRHPASPNFLLVRIGDHAAAERAAEALLRAGIVPRTFGPANPLRGYLRLTVRSRPENERLLEVVGRLGRIAFRGRTPGLELNATLSRGG